MRNALLFVVFCIPVAAAAGLLGLILMTKPVCSPGHVAQFSNLLVGWTCVAGYKP